MSSWDAIEPGEHKFPFALKVRIKQDNFVFVCTHVTSSIVSQCEFPSFYR